MRIGFSLRAIKFPGVSVAGAYAGSPNSAESSS